MKIQNNQQGVITDASQNNQQGVITDQNEINKFLSVKEPVGKTVVRFKENFAVPVSPSNPYYSLFFHSSFDGFQESIANEIDGHRRFEELMSSEASKIENIQAQQMRVKNISTADKKLAKSIADIDQEKNNIITNAETEKDDAITSVNASCLAKISEAEQILNSAKEKKEKEFKPNNFLSSMSKANTSIGFSSRSSDGYFSKQDSSSPKRLNQDLKEIHTTIYSSSVSGFKINGRGFGYYSSTGHSHYSGPLTLNPNNYINQIQYSPNVYYKHTYRSLHYIKFKTNSGQFLEGGKRVAYLTTLDDIRLIRILQGRYKDNLMVNLTLYYIPNYTKQLAKLKEDFIAEHTKDEQVQFGIAKENAETQRKQKCDVAVERYNEAISQAKTQEEAKYSLVKEQHTTDKKLAEINLSRTVLCLVKQTLVVFESDYGNSFRRANQCLV